MQSVLVILCVIFVAGIQGAAYDWKTPEGCSCSCPITYKGPYPPPSSLLHTRDPWSPTVAQPYNPYYNTWNRVGVVDPYVDPYRATNPYNNNKWNQQWNAQWNRTWPYTGTTGQWGAPSVWNRNQWGVAQNPYQWNNTWNRQPWNRWNQGSSHYYPGYAGVNDLRAAVAANNANDGSSSSSDQSSNQSNEAQQIASTTQNPYYYYGIRKQDNAGSTSDAKPSDK